MDNALGWCKFYDGKSLIWPAVVFIGA